VSLIEKRLADEIVELRQQEALTSGGGFVPIADLIAARVEHLEREQQWRGVVAQMAEAVEA
jgi:hypothetical protein